MAKDVVVKIKDAEDKAADIIRDANEKAKRLVADAESEGRAKYKAAITEANAQRDALLKKALADAAAGCAPLDKACDEDVKKILNPDREKFKKAVDAVMGRVVN